MKTFIFNLFFNIFQLGAGLECIPQIHTKRNTQCNKSVGESLAIQCPVSFCSEELPHVTWCKVVGGTCEPTDMGSRLVMEWTGQKENTATYLLTFVAAQLNDTGFYRCTLINQSVNIVGYTITVNITDTIHSREICYRLEDKSKRLYGYLVMLLKILIVIAASSLLFCCLGKITANKRFAQKTQRMDKVTGITDSNSPPKSPAKLQLDAGPLHTPGMASPIESFEIIYDNIPMYINEEKTGNSVEDSNDDKIYIFSDSKKC